MVEMELTAVRVDLQSNTPVVLLQEMGGSRRTLPIFIGAPEATAIAYAMQNVVVQRPAPAPAAASKSAPPTDGDEAWQKLVDELDKP